MYKYSYIILNIIIKVVFSMKKILGILILCLVCCGFTVNSDEDKKNACEFKSNAYQSCSLNEDDECVCVCII